MTMSNHGIGKVWVREPLRSIHGAAQGLPFVLAGHGNGDPFIVAFARIDGMGCMQGVMIAVPLRQAAIDLIAEERLAEKSSEHLQHRQVDILPFPSTAAVFQSHQDGIGSGEARNGVYGGTAPASRCM